MVISNIADGVVRGMETVQGRVNETLFEPVVRLGVTGLARAGKTVFITSLISNMLEREGMGHVTAVREGRILGSFLQPQPDDTIARFEYETHRDALLATPPTWPKSTRSVSELRLSFRVQPNGWMSSLARPRVIHVDIVDYPGEWLLDLQLLDQSFEEWSRGTLARAQNRASAKTFLEHLNSVDANGKFDEPTTVQLAAHYTDYLRANVQAGLSDCTPGRMLLPGDLAGSPVLTFCPMIASKSGARGTMIAEMARRYEAYKAKVVKPFFRDHFARLDRQIVLVDAMGAINSGPEAVEDLRRAMAHVLGAFRPGQNAFLTKLLLGRRVDRILFAATKADYLHHSQHGKLTQIMQALLAEARSRAEFSGAQAKAMSIAALRATSEVTKKHEGKKIEMVQGIRENGKAAAFHAGTLPDDPSLLLSPAREGAQQWLDADFDLIDFAPPRLSQRAGRGAPHIRLDRAVEFLFGDKL